MGLLRHKILIAKGFHPHHLARQPVFLRQSFPRQPMYSRNRTFRAFGDPGFFSKLISGADRFVTGAAGFVPGGNIAVKIADRLTGALKRHPKLAAAGAAVGAAGIGASIEGLLGMHHGGKGAGMGRRRRYRRMNPLNYHALKRSSRRIHMASKIMRTVFHQAKSIRMPKRVPKGVRPHRRRRAAA